MKYYLGIDGGGTKTSFIIIDENKNIIDSLKLGPSSTDTVGIEETKNILRSGIKYFTFPIEACFAGIGGMEKVDVIEVKNLLKKLLPNSRVDVDNDSKNALISAFGFNDGIAVICGTGSATFGKWKGNQYVAGGYGYNEGDPGSAFSLGIEALRYLARVYDGRRKETKFSRELSEVIDCFSHDDMFKYFKNMNRTEVAKLSKIVTKNADDENAKMIIQNSVNGLVEEIIATVTKLSIKGKCPFSIIGGLGNAETYFKVYLLDCLSKRLPNLEYNHYLYEPEFGSALQAMLL